MSVHRERVLGFSAPRVHTLSAVSTAGPSRKVDQKVISRKVLGHGCMSHGSMWGFPF